MADMEQARVAKRVVSFRRAFRREYWPGKRQLTALEHSALRRVAYLEALAEQARVRCLAGEVSLEDVVRMSGEARRARSDLAAVAKPTAPPDKAKPVRQPLDVDRLIAGYRNP